jgi:hypothetical protein
MKIEAASLAETLLSYRPIAPFTVVPNTTGLISTAFRIAVLVFGRQSFSDFSVIIPFIPSFCFLFYIFSPSFIPSVIRSLNVFLIILLYHYFVCLVSILLTLFFFISSPACIRGRNAYTVLPTLISTGLTG